MSISSLPYTCCSFSPGAGKTYTMLGTQDNPGIYFRALNDLFRLVKKHEEENVYNVSMSYLEVFSMQYHLSISFLCIPISVSLILYLKPCLLLFCDLHMASFFYCSSLYH